MEGSTTFTARGMNVKIPFLRTVSKNIKMKEKRGPKKRGHHSTNCKRKLGSESLQKEKDKRQEENGI